MQSLGNRDAAILSNYIARETSVLRKPRKKVNILNGVQLSLVLIFTGTGIDGDPGQAWQRHNG
jgi:hypothetical protein